MRRRKKEREGARRHDLHARSLGGRAREHPLQKGVALLREAPKRRGGVPEKATETVRRRWKAMEGVRRQWKAVEGVRRRYWIWSLSSGEAIAPSLASLSGRLRRSYLMEGDGRRGKAMDGVRRRWKV